MGQASSSWEALLSRQTDIKLPHNHSTLHTPSDRKQLPALPEQVARFDNLSGRDIEALWRTFVVQSDSFAVTKAQLVKVLSVLKESVGGSDPSDSYTECTKAGGELFDFWVELRSQESTQDKYVDMMEVVMALLFLSKMPLEDKVSFLFDCMDFDGDNDLDFAELAISIKSIEGGLARVRREPPATHQNILELVREWFPHLAQDSGDKLSRADFTNFCLSETGVPRRVLELYAEAEGGREPETDDVFTVPRPERPSGGDEFLAIKPWLGAIFPPTKLPEVRLGKPASNLRLEWVHGLALDSAYDNVRYLPDDTGIVFNAAAVGVVLKRDKNRELKEQVKRGELQQHFCMEHTDDVISLAVGCVGSEDKLSVIATGEIGKRPKIEVWTVATDGGEQSIRPLYSLSGLHQRGVCCLAFSVDGGLLATVGMDDDHTVAVYRTNPGNHGGLLSGSAKGSKQRVIAVKWNQYKAEGKEGACDFVTCGVKDVSFWAHDKTGKLTLQKGLLGKAKVASFTAVAFLPKDGNALVGTATGGFYVFKGREFDKEIPPGAAHAHDGPVLSMHSHPDSSNPILVTSGKDGKVIVWRGLLSRSMWDPKDKSIIDLAEILPLQLGVRSAQLSCDRTRLLVGTQSSSIYELRLQYDEKNKASILKDGPLPLVQGHFKGEVWGLAVDPISTPQRSPRFCTVGDDGMLRLWDISRRRALTSHPLDAPARACSFSPDGTLVAVGFGTGTEGKQKYEGALRVYQITDDGEDGAKFVLKHEAKDAKEWISETRWTPDGKMLAAGSHDNAIYLYSVQRFKLRFKFVKHSSYITHLDFSKDSRYMRSVCGAYELLFCDLESGKHVTKASSLADVEWASVSCPLGWSVQGIWPPNADGTDINSVDATSDGKLVATGDDFGKVKVFLHPCPRKNAEFNVSNGHASHVMNVRWSAGNTHLLSVGGNDRSVLQWVHESEVDVSYSRAVCRDAMELAGDNVAHLDDGLVINEKSAVTRAPRERSASLGSIVGGPSGGDEFLAVLPWKGAIVAPSLAPEAQSLQRELDIQLKSVLQRQSQLRERLSSGAGTDADRELQRELRETAARVNILVGRVKRGDDASAPDDDGLSLAWIHGYRSDDCRNNVVYSASSDIVYHAAAVGVVLNAPSQTKKTQRFQTVHTDDIVSFAVHPQKEVVATGQLGKAPPIHVWSVADRQVRSTLQGFHTKGVVLLEFDMTGTMLASVGQCDENTIAIYDWQSGTLRGSAKGGRERILAISFVPGSQDLIAVGVKSVKYWTKQGLNLASKGISLGALKELSFCTVAWLGTVALIGTSTGHVIFLESDTKKPNARKLATATKNDLVKAHQEGAVFASRSIDNGTRVVTGGKDGRIIFWSPSRTIEKVIRIGVIPNNDPPSAHPDEKVVENCQPIEKAIRSVDVLTCKGDAKVLIGTQSAEIYELSVETDSVKTLHGGPLVSGHFKDEVWGLATHALKREYVTCGDDHTLRLWSVQTKTMLRWKRLEGMARACAYSPNEGRLIAVGMGGSVGRGRQRVDGIVKLFDAESMEELASTHDAKEWISDVKFSPDAKSLAAGSHDNCVYIYTVITSNSADGGVKVLLKLRSKFARHNSYITHIDWSSDSSWLRSNCGAYELLFSNAQSGKQVTKASDLRDVQWATCTCVLNWAVQGIYPPGADGTDVNAVDRSHVGTILATGDDSGKVKVFRYPCVEKHARYQERTGHSSHTTNVRWTAYDECLISTGGNDKCVFQWLYPITADAGSDAVTSSNPSKDRDSRFGATSDQHELPEDEANIPIRRLEPEGPPGPGDEFMATKPWLGSIRAPDCYTTEPGLSLINPKRPKYQLQLEYIHGFTGHTYRGNLFYGAEGHLIFPAAAVGVVMEVDREGGRPTTNAESGGTSITFAGKDAALHQQSFYLGHDDDVISLTVCPRKRFVATGQIGKQASVHVWDSSTRQRMSTLPPFHQRGVSALAFHPSEPRLASVGLDDEHSVAVWRDTGGAWSKVTREATGKGDRGAVFFILWVHAPEQAKGNDDEVYNLVTGGVKHVKFWQVSAGALNGRKGVFDKTPVPPALLCAANTVLNGEWRVVTGSSTGDVLVWKGRTCVMSKRNAHDKALQCMAGVVPTADGSVVPPPDRCRLVTGGKDGRVKVWNSALECMQEYDLASYRVSLESSIRAVDYMLNSSDSSPTGQPNTRALNISRIVVGTARAEIFELTMGQSQGDVSVATLLQGHFADEVWGLDVPSSAQASELSGFFVTSGDDGTVRIWDAEARCMVTKLFLPKRRMPPSNGQAKSSVKKEAKMEVKKQEVLLGKRAGAAPTADDDAVGPEADPTASSNRQMSRAVAWELSTGRYILVGLGGDNGKMPAAKAGGHVVLRVERDRGRWEFRGPGGEAVPSYSSCLEKEWVSDVKWCPAGQDDVVLTYAVGSHDNLIRIYGIPSEHDPTVKETQKPVYLLRLQGHNSFITHLDFAVPDIDGQCYLQSTCGGYELLFWSVNLFGNALQEAAEKQGNLAYSQVLTQMSSTSPDASNNLREAMATAAEDIKESKVVQAKPMKASNARNANWATFTTVLGWPVQGIWSGWMDGSDVNAVCRFDSPQPLLAVGGDDGKVKLYHYPCTHSAAQFVEGRGHASHVTNVRPMVVGKQLKLISTGGNDKSVFLWRVVPV